MLQCFAVCCWVRVIEKRPFVWKCAKETNFNEKERPKWHIKETKNPTCASLSASMVSLWHTRDLCKWKKKQERKRLLYVYRIFVPLQGVHDTKETCTNENDPQKETYKLIFMTKDLPNSASTSRFVSECVSSAGTCQKRRLCVKRDLYICPPHMYVLSVYPPYIYSASTSRFVCECVSSVGTGPNRRLCVERDLYICSPHMYVLPIYMSCVLRIYVMSLCRSLIMRI